MYYSFKVNDAVTMTPAYFQNTNRNNAAGDDVSGFVFETVFKFKINLDKSKNAHKGVFFYLQIYVI